jgi:D-alanyl-D-alanine carboxypeptidase (penicillin-binding protein 5/6)
MSSKKQQFSLGVLLFFLLSLPGQNSLAMRAWQPSPVPVRATGFEDFVPSKYPKKVFAEKAPWVSAAAVMVRDLESGVTLYGSNTDEKRPMASLTKLMTALVALDYYSPNQVLTVKRLQKSLPGESDMGLAVGDQVSVKNLIYGLLVPSGNDAAYTFADNYPGGFENFIYSMNKKAENLHMFSTHFANPSGLDESDHYSTASDLSLLAIEALKNPLVSDAVATYGITLADAPEKKFYQMKNVNQFLGYLNGADGVKTGNTDLAGQCLVASVSRDGHRVISVVLDSRSRFIDSANLLEWAYRNFVWVNPNDNQN